MPSTGKQKMLLLSGRLGDGHKQAALALAETAKQHRPDMETELRDFMEWTHPYLHEVSRYLFIQGVKAFPSVYGFLYQKTRDDNSLSSMFKKIRLFGLNRMMQLIRETNPSVVVSTFPSAAAAMSILKQEGLTDVPTVTVITDHTDHSYWIHPMTDKYLVGSDPVKQALRRRGVLPGHIEVTGIPVRPQFYGRYDMHKLRLKYGLDPHTPAVLVMGGGCGIIGEDAVEMISSRLFPRPVQFIAVCGHNRKLQESLTESALHAPHPVKVFGFVDEIHELMALSNLIITKPGGLTTSEALALGVPMLLYHALPGQEEDNARILCGSGAAVHARHGHLFRELQQLLLFPRRLEIMREKSKDFSGLHAAERALDTIIHTSGNRPIQPAAELILVGGGV
ncbi:MGDG synthase family glycosyltransferase [Paenibacillus turpanensis]|uniref:MGDG synthase family glycosyltransferase n=1 Tax=Paenibacillus turpanensis TaxID=2689078 RepID=UPI00140CF502|nr:glycosyltransferase [Paenibacillus turpanensis]